MGDMYHGERERLACNCGNAEDLQIAINTVTNEIIVGCPECQKDIIRGPIRWMDQTVPESDQDE